MTLSLQEVVAARAALLEAVRRALREADGTEVVTPMAAPFYDLAPVPQLVVQHPRSGVAYVLRVAPEEHLLRLVSRGIHAVYEVSTNFRAEDCDRTHLVEFQSVEALFGDATVDDMQDLVERMCREANQAVQDVIRPHEPRRWLDSSPFARVDLPQWIADELGVNPDSVLTRDGLSTISERLSLSADGNASPADIADELIGYVASQYSRPVFISGLPGFLGGPAAPHHEFKGFLARSELYVGGLELGSVATQMSDTASLTARYVANAELRRELGIGPAVVNEACVAEIRQGLPSLYAGLGIGLDRLLMLCVGDNDVRNLHPFWYDWRESVAQDLGA